MNKQLENIHLLIVDNNESDRNRLVEYLTAEGAVCHTAKTRAEALGLYLTLTLEKIVPRAVILDWYLNPPDSLEFEFYNAINRPESNNAKILIERFVAVDPAVTIIVHSAYLDDMVHEGLPVRLLQKGNSFSKLVEVLTSCSSFTRKAITVKDLLHESKK
jgi:CheY-like chemotaxis protein